MRLEGSCHCQAVRFQVEAYAPYPFLRCYCSICRKVAGSGGYAINLGAYSDTLVIEGEEHLRVYDAIARSPGEVDGPGRRFCANCATALWNYDPDYPELVHPFPSCIDSPLPQPPATIHMMLGSKADWVVVQAGPDDECFDTYPNESLEQWHRRHGLLERRRE